MSLLVHCKDMASFLYLQQFFQIFRIMYRIWHIFIVFLSCTSALAKPAQNKQDLMQLLQEKPERSAPLLYNYEAPYNYELRPKSLTRLLGALRVTRKLLIVTTLGVFRVSKIPTLKIPKVLIYSRLQVVLNVLNSRCVRQQEAPMRTRPSHYRGPLPLVPRAASPHRGNLVAGYNGFGYLHLVQLAV